MEKTTYEELNDLYSSPNIFRVIKSRRMSWAGHVARMGGEEKCIQGYGGETCGKDRSVDGRILIRWISGKWDVGVWTGSSWLRIGTGGRHL